MEAAAMYSLPEVRGEHPTWHRVYNITGQCSEGQCSEGQCSEGQCSEGQDSEGQDSEGQCSEGQDSLTREVVWLWCTAQLCVVFTIHVRN